MARGLEAAPRRKAVSCSFRNSHGEIIAATNHGHAKRIDLVPVLIARGLPERDHLIGSLKDLLVIQHLLRIDLIGRSKLPLAS